MEGYKVVEHFVSINGEAQAAGELACFIRFAGCNLNCSYCDTKWANTDTVSYQIMRAEEICDHIRATGVKNVTLTGGEPLIQNNIDRLLMMLAQDTSLRVEIETNGSVDIKPFKDIDDRLVFTLDYKLPGSGMENHMLTDNYAWLTKKDAVKFVISDASDMDRARDIIAQYGLEDKTTVYWSSAFDRISPADIVEYMKKYRMNGIRLQLQLHKYIWEPDRKGV